MSKLMMSDMDIADLERRRLDGNAYSKMAEAEGATPASTDTVVVYNNKGANVDVSYMEHYAAKWALVTHKDLTLAALLDWSIELREQMVPWANHSEIIMLPSLEEGSDAFDRVTEVNDDAGEGAVDPTTIDGTFHGLEGSFACGPTCKRLQTNTGGRRWV